MSAQPPGRSADVSGTAPCQESDPQPNIRDLPEPWPQTETEVSHYATKAGLGQPTASWLFELDALRWQLHESVVRFANEQEDIINGVWSKLRADLIDKHAFPQPEVLPPVTPFVSSPIPTPRAAQTNEDALSARRRAFASEVIDMDNPQGLMENTEASQAGNLRQLPPANLPRTGTSSVNVSRGKPSLKVAGLWRSTRFEGGRMSHTLAHIVHRLVVPEATLMRRVLLFLISVIAWFEELHEPERSGFCSRMVLSKKFEALRTIVIALNGVFIVETANHEMQQVQHGSPVAAIDVNFLGEVFFTCFYVFELASRMFVHRLFFFCNEDWKWNLFDLVVVFSSGADLALQFSSAGNTEDDSTNMTFLRVCRVFKITKIIRVFRAVHFVGDLRMMVDSVFGSFFALFWCIVLISFVLYIFALFFVQSMANFVGANQEVLDEAQTKLIFQYFGSVEVAIVSLFQATTGGEDWRHFYDSVSLAGPLQSAVFIFYITFFVVAAWNIVTSTFVEKALKLAQPDIESLLLEKRRNDIVDGREFLKLLAELSGGMEHRDRITLDEFLKLSENERFLDFFHIRGVDIKDAEMFFRMLASVSDTEYVELRTFVAGCLRMKGLATSIDLHTLTFETKEMVSRQGERYFQIAARMARLDERLDKILGDDVGLRRPASCLIASPGRSLVSPPTAPATAAAAAAAAATETMAAARGLCEQEAPPSPSPPHRDTHARI